MDPIRHGVVSELLFLHFVKMETISHAKKVILFFIAWSQNNDDSLVRRALDSRKTPRKEMIPMSILVPIPLKFKDSMKPHCHWEI